MYNVDLVVILTNFKDQLIGLFLYYLLTDVYTLYILILNGDDTMEAKLQKWGNSYGIRIPNTLLKALNLKTNDIVDLIQEEDKIIISKSEKNRISLADRFRQYNGENLAKEFEWDEPTGREKW